ncbi:hypothetical protein BK651_22835 [Pseudomonas rhodesiae]|nr:hypothetical protein BK650_20015 [Pseudomonas rhodesiae]ROM61321.1 hypothetical protein BK651_22835 [Pseudomonas rhodesiae]
MALKQRAKLGIWRQNGISRVILDLSLIKWSSIWFCELRMEVLTRKWMSIFRWFLKSILQRMQLFLVVLSVVLMRCMQALKKTAFLSIVKIVYRDPLLV